MQSFLGILDILTVALNPGSRFCLIFFHSWSPYRIPTSAHTLTPLTLFFCQVSSLTCCELSHNNPQNKHSERSGQGKKEKGLDHIFWSRLLLSLSRSWETKRASSLASCEPPHPPPSSPSQLFLHGLIRKNEPATPICWKEGRKRRTAKNQERCAQKGVRLSVCMYPARYGVVVVVDSAACKETEW